MPDMKDEIILKFTKEEMSYLLTGVYLNYREYRDSQYRWPYPPAEVAQECSGQAYRLYMRIKMAYEEIRKEEKRNNESLDKPTGGD